jgi:urea carboxylase-associated protein 1
MHTLSESSLHPSAAIFDATQPAGEPWLHTVKRGQILRIVDLEGNQAVDTIFYNAHDRAESYSVPDTLQKQGGIYLGTGSVLYSNRGNAMVSIVADTCGRHDTLGGACSAESNTVRYAPQTKFMHSCRDNFLLALAHADIDMDKRDLAPNVNFFMNVPVGADGSLAFADGLSGPGKYVEMRAEMDVLVLISNCPQLNNPCNAYNPTPVQFLIWNPQG